MPSTPETCSCNEIFPYRASYELDEQRFGSQEPLDPRRFEPHSIDVISRADGIYELYVVNHVWRESVEVFEIRLDWNRPTLRWIGCAQLPAPAIGNSVAAVHGGGFVVSFNIRSKASQGRADKDTGGVYEWFPGNGWRRLPHSEIDSANGIAVSHDGTWVYLAGWRSRCLKKVRREGLDHEPDVVATSILTDNLTWTADGKLLAAGAFDTPADQFTAAYQVQVRGFCWLLGCCR